MSDHTKSRGIHKIPKYLLRVGSVLYPLFGKVSGMSWMVRAALAAGSLNFAFEGSKQSARHSQNILWWARRRERSHHFVLLYLYLLQGRRGGEWTAENVYKHIDVPLHLATSLLNKKKEFPLVTNKKMKRTTF